ncbi:MAG: ubiquinol-cytochrome c reductase iron-sulfur subunit [Burkholderiales bacterium RIFCSPLOWO2_12_67_14]|nr:MAG: ubiquinol-cytochrome c reductase iron-sulfur subunit [Burkholderiales bacterium RIFCSPLOWO2_02_FULL_67_64]OGB50341.1 MAG: ubiquinol-cytochrome c reductase iron-sulfur subunit [Burkholderiales bacterium RIFCSPLOWO2_12_67_14]OGB50605.1 MAG: ubiquinol-cytochrome c reductase iron-sulfur subunit [Burkholderiales bacterium RIFCSPHIGHO2_12_FULL_67_38]OGB98380.1 MAG: ubiquinol-cytochrome c reductase iron-sulfur subunit [Burkholderiales bacterium RIFCSPLOWO2_12_FULL_67_210]
MSHAPALPLPPDSGMDPERRTWLLATGAMGAAATAAVAVPFVASFAPSERAKAQGAAVTMDPTTVAPGELRTVEWRGQPVWVMRRTPEMLASLEGITDLADPASRKQQQPGYATNTHRSIKPELFVTVGICTHLGCSPVTLPEGTANPSVPADWKGGFFCPCHGSTFDLAGRVFKNKPAPTNLVVPPHKYLADGSLLIGEDDSGAA